MDSVAVQFGPHYNQHVHNHPDRVNLEQFDHRTLVSVPAPTLDSILLLGFPPFKPDPLRRDHGLGSSQPASLGDPSEGSETAAPQRDQPSLVEREKAVGAGLC